MLEEGDAGCAAVAGRVSGAGLAPYTRQSVDANNAALTRESDRSIAALLLTETANVVARGVIDFDAPAIIDRQPVAAGEIGVPQTILRPG